jgi:uncharacterized protein (TIGR02271 family)
MGRHRGEPAADGGSADSRPIHAQAPERDGETGNQPVSPSDQTLTVQLREEDLVAEKQLVQIGVVRIRRRLITETRTIEVPVTREELIVEHLPVEALSSSELEAAAVGAAQPALAERLRALQLGQTLRLPIAEEEITIQKRPVVTRELTVDKRLVEEVRRFSEGVRREDVRITSRAAEQLEAGQARGPSDSSGTLSSDIGTAAPEEQVPHSPDFPWTLELLEEEPQVHTELVDAGSVEVRTGVVSERKSLVLRVTHEETDVEQVAVEHRPSERAIGSGEDSFDIPVFGERVTLRKQPVVTEEITLRTEAIEDVQPVTTTVRREVAHFEVEGNVRFHAVEASEPEDG